MSDTVGVSDFIGQVDRAEASLDWLSHGDAVMVAHLLALIYWMAGKVDLS